MPRVSKKVAAADGPVEDAAPAADSNPTAESNDGAESPATSALGRGARRRGTRVDYRAALRLDLDGDEDEDEDAANAAGDGSRKPRRRRKGADDDDDDGDDDFKVAEQGEDEDEDDYMELDPQDIEDEGTVDEMDVDDEGSIGSDFTPRRGKRGGARTPRRSYNSGRGRRGVNSAMRTSLQKRAGDSVSSKNIWPIHEQQPMYLPGKTSGGLVRVDEILSLQDVGLRKPSLTQLTSKAAQNKAVEAQRNTWIDLPHHTAIKAGSSNDLMVDTRWYPGRDPSRGAETAARISVAEYWRQRRNGQQDECRSILAELETVGGVLPLDMPGAQGNMQILQDR